VTKIELDVWSFNDEARRAFASLGFRKVMERMALSAELPDQAGRSQEDRRIHD
jgi:hypothetical protein